MKTSKTLLFLLSLCILTWCVSCDNDKDGDKDAPGYDDYTDSKLTPDQHKAKIEEIGKNFIAKFKASENETVAKSLNELTQAIDESYNFDEVFGDETAVTGISTLSAALASIITQNDLNALTQSSEPDVYRWAKYTGIYTYNASTQRWSKTAAAKTVEFHYGNSVLQAKYSGEQDYNQVEDVIIEVPAQTDIILKVNGEEVLNFTANISLKDNQKSVDAKIKLVLSSHYIWSLDVVATGSKATAMYSMSIKGENLMSASIELTGNNMTDPNNLEANGDHLDKNFTSAQFNYQLLNIAINGNGKLKEMIQGDNNLNYDYNWGDEAGSKAYAEESAKIFNDYASMSMYYTNEKEKIADVKLKVDFKERYTWSEPNTTWKEYYTYPVLIFTSDNSELAIEDYFTDSNFNSLIQSVENLINEFADMLDLDPVDL